MNQCLLMPLIGLLCLVACGDSDKKDPSAASDQVVSITISNPGPDTVHSFGLDVDLIPIDSQLILLKNGTEIPFQFEDRNVNGLPDRLFSVIDLMPATQVTLSGVASTQARTLPSTLVQAVMMDQDGQSLSTFTYETASNLRHQGVILENQRIAYRALMQGAFAFDVIGKRFPDLVTHKHEDISEEADWGGDVLDEGETLGIGSPALYDQTQIIRFDQFDSREVQVLAAGPLRAEVAITVKGILVRGEKLDVRMNLEMHADAQWVDVTLELLSRTDLTLQFGFGLPKHEEATDFTQGLESGVHFAYTYGLQSAQGDQLGLALLVPEIYELDHYRDHPQDYFYLATPIDKKVQYRFMAAWVKGPRTIFDEVDFLNFVRKEAQFLGLLPSAQVTWTK